MVQEPSIRVNSRTGAGALGKRLVIFPLDLCLGRRRIGVTGSHSRLDVKSEIKHGGEQSRGRGRARLDDAIV